jgi:hypothetical protein
MLADRLAAAIGLDVAAALVVAREPRLRVFVCHQRLLSSASSRPAMHPTPVTNSRSSRSDRTRFVLAAIAGLVGLVWLLQGVGVLPGSVMSNDPFWAVAGLALIAAASVYAAWPRLRGR